jgi:hypothetical protein
MFGPGFGGGSSQNGGGRHSIGASVVLLPSDDVSGSIGVSVVLDDPLASSAVVDVCVLVEGSGAPELDASVPVVGNTAGSAAPHAASKTRTDDRVRPRIDARG